MKKVLFVPLLVIILALSLVAIPAGAKPPATVNVQILAVNDFHGNLLPPSGSSGRVGATQTAGGVEYLATHINNLRALNPNTVVVSAGDLIGASPLLSALFHDEPTIEAFNQIGLDFNAVGNHESMKVQLNSCVCRTVAVTPWMAARMAMLLRAQASSS